MDELLAWLFAAAVQLSGLPATPERPPVKAMPYPEMLREICSDLKDEAQRMLAQYDRCALGQGMQRAGCEEFKPDFGHYERCTHQSGLQAAYMIGQQRIVYRDDLKLDNDADNSFIVHEFVHALQEAQRGPAAFASCGGVIAAERQAYAVQQKYLRSRGQMLRVGERLRMVGCDGID